jgi:hypothetical protein
MEPKKARAIAEIVQGNPAEYEGVQVYPGEEEVKDAWNARWSTQRAYPRQWQ